MKKHNIRLNMAALTIFAAVIGLLLIPLNVSASLITNTNFQFEESDDFNPVLTIENMGDGVLFYGMYQSQMYHYTLQNLGGESFKSISLSFDSTNGGTNNIYAVQFEGNGAVALAGNTPPPDVQFTASSIVIGFSSVFGGVLETGDSIEFDIHYVDLMTNPYGPGIIINQNAAVLGSDGGINGKATFVAETASIPEPATLLLLGISGLLLGLFTSIRKKIHRA
jgi:hypothetical protein